MTSLDIAASFGPGAADRTSLSRSHRSVLDQIFQHPLAHGLEWMDVLGLVKEIGSVEHKANDETCFVIAGERHLFRKPHTKDMPAAMLIDLRHMLRRGGWSPHAARSKTPACATVPHASDLLVVVEQSETWIYRLDFASGTENDHVIRSDLSPHRLRELARMDRSHETGGGWRSDPDYYERIAVALEEAGNIILAGHGHGHGNAMHDLKIYLQQHHAAIAVRLGAELGLDLASHTGAQRRVLGRSALVEPAPASGA